MAKPLSTEKQQQWREKFQKQRDSGLSIKQWCHDNCITTQSFFYWRARLFPTPDLSRFHFKEIPDEACFRKLKGSSSPTTCDTAIFNQGETTEGVIGVSGSLCGSIIEFLTGSSGEGVIRESGECGLRSAEFRETVQRVVGIVKDSA